MLAAAAFVVPLDILIVGGGGCVKRRVCASVNASAAALTRKKKSEKMLGNEISVVQEFDLPTIHYSRITSTTKPLSLNLSTKLLLRNPAVNLSRALL
jgi:hypothetical protein